MRSFLSQSQILYYQKDGYVLVENFVTEEELSFWRQAVTEAMEQRGGKKMPDSDTKIGKDDGINKDSDYYGKVFDQMPNLWKINVLA